MTKELYSIRMRAARGGQHISGAERLTGPEGIEELAAALVRRALEHEKGRPDTLHLAVDAVAPEALRTGRLPDLRTLRVTDFRQGRAAARQLLIEAGVSPEAVSCAMGPLAAGAATGGGSMRGAMLVDAASGERLEADSDRGVRASRMDLSPEAEAELRHRLARQGLDNPHVREALVLAGKVLAAPGLVAELCWSDDPGYVAGYVAAPQLGYVRLTRLKPAGEERGGRAFFVRRPECDLQQLIAFLEEVPMLFTEIGQIGAAADWRE